MPWALCPCQPLHIYNKSELLYCYRLHEVYVPTPNQARPKVTEFRRTFIEIKSILLKSQARAGSCAGHQFCNAL